MPLMESMEIVIISIMIIFIAAAYQDLKKREVSNWLTLAAWLLTAILFQGYPEMLFFFIVFFIGVWILAELSEKLGKPLMAFGDVLWFPIFAALIAFQPGDTILYRIDYGKAIVLAATAILVSQLYLWYRLKWERVAAEKVRGVPFVLILLIFTLAAGAAAFFFP